VPCMRGMDELWVIGWPYWGRHFWARGYFCVTSGEVTEEMIEEYLEHHFEPKADDHFRTE
jgi:putative transposase